MDCVIDVRVVLLLLVFVEEEEMRLDAKLAVESLESRRMLTDFVVNTFEDFADDGDPSTMSLREAVAIANEMPGPDSILFDPAIFNQGRTIALSLGEIGITDELSIDASDLEQRVTIDAQLQSRVLNVQGPVAGSYSFSNLRLIRGSFITCAKQSLGEGNEM